MKCVYTCLLFCALAIAALAQTVPPSIKGLITDPSGSFVPGALIQVRGPGGERRVSTDGNGRYAVGPLQPGTYQVRVIAKGFSVSAKPGIEVKDPVTLDVQLTITAETQVVNVEDTAGNVSADPASNGSAIVLGQKELAALSDDPDELQQELQAMAGPGSGPEGGQIYIDGFSGGSMPPKSSIREVRINSNPFSPEYDRPGFGRIEIFTKPGSDKLHGQAFVQYNKEALNSRSPLLTQSQRPPYQTQFYGLNLTGPILKNKASFGFDLERRDIHENAFIYATELDSNLNPVAVNQGVVTPQTRTSLTPRLDYTMNEKNTLVARYQFLNIGLDKQGIGDFSLPSRAYNESNTEHTFQATETAVLSPTAINETRFQYLRTSLGYAGASSAPAIIVQGAFTDGGASVGNSMSSVNKVEVTNSTAWTHKTHTFKWGARIRQSFNNDTSLNGFNGAYTFFGGVGPALDANLQAISGTAVQLTALERYRRTRLLTQAGYSAAQIRLLGGGASQFNLNTGAAATAINQFDVGMWLNDDWRIKPNLTLSYGVRYETQTNIGDWADWAPRFGIAWGIGGGANKQAKTVLRAGLGVFYDRILDSVTLSADRYNGIAQQSYLLQNPDTYPVIPSISLLQANKLPQQLQLKYSGLRAPRVYQASVGLDRQITKYFRVSAQYIESRGVALSRSRNINTPINGVYPFGDANLRLLTETDGFSRSHQLFVSPNMSYKKMFLFGFYALSYGKDDNEGQPANPYSLRAEWGPSSFADVRHRGVLGTSIPLPWNISLSPFILTSSGTPYNITTGRDLLLTGSPTQRPALETSVSQANCNSGNLVYAAGFGCFNVNPAPGTPSIGRNSARGPANFTVNLRLARTWAFGNRGESGVTNQGGMAPGMGGVRGGGGPPPGGMPGGGPPGGMFGANSGKKYNLTLSISARNVLNHANYAAPSGDLSSPYFGESRSLAGFGPFGASTTYNRKIDLQLRFQF